MPQRTLLLLFSLITLFAGLGCGVLFQVYAISLLPEGFRPAAWGFSAGFWFMFGTLGILLVLAGVEPVKPDA